MLSSIFVLLGNLCLSDNDIFDFPYEEVVPVCNDDLLAREGHQLQGIRRRQQLMSQLMCNDMAGKDN